MDKFLILLFTLSLHIAFGQSSTADSSFTNRPQTPIMGWCSWYNYRININEDLIKNQADAMANNGMKDAGYAYINIDDGFFGGRDKNGHLLVHPKRFPGGMKVLADYIHALGFKAGIYSDAGPVTCSAYWDQDTIEVGSGLYGHEYQDLSLFLKDWGYDHMKIDWCGGDWLGLDEQTQFTLLGSIIRKLRPDVVYNVCRWQFPGKWVVNVADSWRIATDISDNFEKILAVIDQNADLWPYAGPGHVNDMDMLQVGRGMSYEEDKTHFSMWCMMASPLIASNDLTTVSDQTLGILTNQDLIAINQDPFVYQARRIVDEGDLEIWARPLKSTMSGKIAVALLNRSLKKQNITMDLEKLGINPAEGYTVRDCWEHKISSRLDDAILTYEVAPHGVVVLKVEGTSVPFNVFQRTLENTIFDRK